MVAPAAARDADLLGELGGVVEDQHLASALAGLGRAHHAGGTGADHDDVEVGSLGGDSWEPGLQEWAGRIDRGLRYGKLRVLLHLQSALPLLGLVFY